MSSRNRATESYYEKRKRIKEEQKKRNEKLLEEKKRKELAKKQLEMAKSLSSKRPTKSKSSKLGSSSYSAGSKNPTSVFQDKKTTTKTTKKKDTNKSNKAVSVIKNMFKNKGTAKAEESAPFRDKTTKKKTTAASSVKVGKGNTLSGIAKDKGITLKALLEANPNISDPNKIRVGQSIKIPESGKGSVYKGMTKEEMKKIAMNRGGTTMMKKKTKYMAKGGMKKTKYMAKGGATKKTKMYARGGAAKKK
jgi:LysM repeat protein